MKIRIKSEPYYRTPAPKVTKDMMDWFWGNFWKVRNNVLGYTVHKDTLIPVETLEVKINQALPWMSHHFYITINGAIQYHMEAYDYEFKKYKEFNEDSINRYHLPKEYYSRKKHFFEYTNQTE